MEPLDFYPHRIDIDPPEGYPERGWIHNEYTCIRTRRASCLAQGMCAYACSYLPGNLIPKSVPLSRFSEYAGPRELDELLKVGVLTDAGDAWELHGYRPDWTL